MPPTFHEAKYGYASEECIDSVYMAIYSIIMIFLSRWKAHSFVEYNFPKSEIYISVWLKGFFFFLFIVHVFVCHKL